MHSDAPFPLTLTLSPREREQLANTLLQPLISARGPALTAILPLPWGEETAYEPLLLSLNSDLGPVLTAILPLPKGEGRGEGEVSFRLNHSR